jgi:hypothetical protein
VSGGTGTGVPAYLVGQYWPGVTTERLLELHTEAAKATEEMDSERTHVRSVNCALIPSERPSSRCLWDHWG